MGVSLLLNGFGNLADHFGAVLTWVWADFVDCGDRSGRV